MKCITGKQYGKWWMSQRNQTHSTIQEINPDLHPNMYTAVIILMVMSVSTATANRRATMITALYNDNGTHVGLALMHIYKDTELDAECFIHQFIRHFWRLNWWVLCMIWYINRSSFPPFQHVSRSKNTVYFSIYSLYHVLFIPMIYCDLKCTVC